MLMPGNSSKDCFLVQLLGLSIKKLVTCMIDLILAVCTASTRGQLLSIPDLSYNLIRYFFPALSRSCELKSSQSLTDLISSIAADTVSARFDFFEWE